MTTTATFREEFGIEMTDKQHAAVTTLAAAVRAGNPQGSHIGRDGERYIQTFHQDGGPWVRVHIGDSRYCVCVGNDGRIF